MKITSFNLVHNHPLEYNLYKEYIQNRKLDGDGENLAKTLIEAKFNKIRELIHLKFDKKVVEKDIHNLRVSIKKNERQDKSNAQLLENFVNKRVANNIF